MEYFGRKPFIMNILQTWPLFKPLKPDTLRPKYGGGRGTTGMEIRTLPQEHAACARTAGGWLCEPAFLRNGRRPGQAGSGWRKRAMGPERRGASAQARGRCGEAGRR